MPANSDGGTDDENARSDSSRSSTPRIQRTKSSSSFSFSFPCPRSPTNVARSISRASRRPASSSPDGVRPTKHLRPSMSGEDPDDPIDEFTLEPAVTPHEQVSPSVVGDQTLSPGAIHAPQSTPGIIFFDNSTSSPPLTEPSASYDAAIDAFTTPPGLPTLPSMPSTPSQIPLPPEEDMDTDTIVVESSGPVREGTAVEQAAPPNQEPSQPLPQPVSQIPIPPTKTQDMRPVTDGRGAGIANLLLTTVTKAGGNAQKFMNEEPKIEHALHVTGQLLSDMVRELGTLADNTIATGDRTIYQNMTAVRSEFRSIIYNTLRDLDDRTEIDREIGQPTETIPTDMFAVIRALTDMRESHELDMLELRNEIKNLKQEQAPRPLAKEPIPSRASTSRVNTPPKPAAPKPAAPKSKTAPAPPKRDQPPHAPTPATNEAQGGWGYEPTNTMDWADQFDEGQIPPEPQNTGPTDTDKLLDTDGGFQTVTKGRGKAHGAAPKPSFAQAARAGAKRPAPQPPVVDAERIANAMRTAGKSTTPVRYVAWSNSYPEDFKRMTPRTMYQLINDVFIRRNSHVRLIHGDWNKKNRLVLQFPHATPLAEIQQAIPDLIKALSLPEDTKFDRCMLWSKVAISRCPTGIESGVRYSSEELLQHLQYNSHAAMLEIGQAPRWVTRDPDPSKTHSTFTVAFEDNISGSILASFLSQTTYMFGERMKITRWNDKPTLKGCSRCQDLGHFARECRNQPRCGICAGRHLTGEHRRACTMCKKENRASSLPCIHPMKCANCGLPHGATDPACARRAAYRAPITKTLREAEDTRADAPEDSDDE